MVTISTKHDCDYLLVGGGLQNGLIALAVRQLQPHARIVLVERQLRLGGNHTWCFHADDIEKGASGIVSPLVDYRWDGYEVRFPAHQRKLATPYAAVTSTRFDQVVRAALAAPNCRVYLGSDAQRVGAHSVALHDGRTFEGQVVVDSRGPDRAAVDPDTAGYQKFVGLEVLAPGHGLSRPILMDALVEQVDGFRFLYVLPLGPDHLLLEDTRFSDTPDLDVRALANAIFEYADARGYRFEKIVRTEQGVLPLPWRGDIALPGDTGAIRGGYQGGWFHPVTGYSFPVAMRLALHLASVPVAEARGSRLAALVDHQRRQLAFCHRLNKMLFTWFAPATRFHVLERFYTLPEPVVRRFYAMQTTRVDRARILVGRPPRGMSYRAALFGRSPV